MFHTTVGVADDVLVKLTLGEEVSGAIEATAVTNKGATDVPAMMTLKVFGSFELEKNRVGRRWQNGT